MDSGALTRRLRALASLDNSYTAQVSGDYLRTQSLGMVESWRAKMVDWFEGLATAFDLDRATVASAVHYLDAYLSRKSCSPVNYQLVAVGALFLATKIEEPRPLTTSDLCLLTEGVFSREDLRLVELELLCTLQWRLHPPAAEAFVRIYAEMLAGPGGGPARVDVARVEATALEFAAAAQRDYAFAACPRHVVAAAATLAALRDLDAPRDVAEAWTRRLDRAGIFAPARAEDAVAACGLRLLAKVAPHRLPAAGAWPRARAATPADASPDAELRDLADAAAAAAASPPPSPPRHDSPTDATADVYFLGARKRAESLDDVADAMEL